MIRDDDLLPCFCHSGLDFNDCCAPIIHGDRPAATAEALMRSRYSAYVLGDNAYLLSSWHPSTRPHSLYLLPNEQGWIDLRIIDRQGGRCGDMEGRVHFRASYQQDQDTGVLEENSRFLFEQGEWLYLDGDIIPQVARRKVGRNEPCPCGSGRKYKKCCG